MAIRRNMTDAMTPEKVAFIKGEPLPALDPPVEHIRPVKPARPTRERVTLTVRLESDIVHALVRASAERKIRQEDPYTQQDIVSAALRQWLHEAGFLSE
jgi:hypothetical protein